MSITGILVLVGIGAVGILVVWLSIRKKRVSGIIEDIGDDIKDSENEDEKRKAFFAEIDAKIAEIQGRFDENEVLIVKLREEARTEKYINAQEKKKALARDAVNYRNRMKTEQRRAKIEKEKLEREYEKDNPTTSD